MKKGKRSLIVVAVVLFVCAAVWLNWSYNSKEQPAPVDADMVMAEDAARAEAEKVYGASLSGEDASAVLNELGGSGDEAQTAGDAAVETGGYFASARLTRQQTRDSALELLSQAAAAENASQEVIDAAMAGLADMANYSMQESQVENLLIAKGFADCVVFLSDESVTVAVPAPLEGLSEADVARITDTVLAETGLSASDMRVIEVKGEVTPEEWLVPEEESEA